MGHSQTMIEQDFKSQTLTSLSRKEELIYHLMLGKFILEDQIETGLCYFFQARSNTKLEKLLELKKNSYWIFFLL